MRAHLHIAAILVLSATGAGACGDATPADPTWADVQPILMANCARCHGGVSPIGGAPTVFRLDLPYFVANAEGDKTYGAATMADFAVARACTQGDMPVIGPKLSGRQCDILERWAARHPAQACADDPEGLCGRIDDHQAGPVLLEPATPATADSNVQLVVFIEDADRDQAVGILRWSADNDAGIITDRLHGGRNEIIWDTRSVPEGTWSLTVQIGQTLDPINGSFLDYDLGPVTVTHVSGNTAPRASFSQTLSDPGTSLPPQPAADQIVSDVDSPFEIRFAVTDPDSGDPLTYDVAAVAGATRIDIAAAVPVVPGPVLQTVSWDTTSTPEGSNWHIVVTIHDGTTIASTRSPAFIVAHRGLSSVTCSDVQVEVLDRYCEKCHGTNENARVFGGPDLTQADCDYAVVNRGILYRMVIQKREMPPPSARHFDVLPITQAHRDMLEEWLLGGTPL